MKKKWWILLGIVAVAIVVIWVVQDYREAAEKTRQDVRKEWVELGSSGYFKTLSEYDADRFAKENAKDADAPYGMWIRRRGEADAFVISAGGGRCAVYLRDPSNSAVLYAQALLDIPFATEWQQRIAAPRLEEYGALLQFTRTPDLPHQHMTGANGQTDPPPAR